jgi:hypothetical protein
LSKIITASCEASVVTADDIAVDATILSEGIGASEGLLVLDKTNATYLTSNASDLKTAIEKVISALNKVTDTLTAIGTGMTGSTTAPPAALPINVALITAIVTELTTLKESLK